MRIRDWIILVFFATVTLAWSQGVPPEIPKHLQALAPDSNFASARTIAVAVTSRRAKNPDTPQDLEHLRKFVLNTLSKTHFTVVSDKSSAELSLEFIVEPNVRYGMFHYQNSPYVYLTLRETSNERLVYCAYRRAGYFRSASQRLLLEFRQYLQHIGQPPSGSLEDCAEQAMRPLSIEPNSH